MKFGKHQQRRQLEMPEYSAAFVNYKGLKKLIKHLSATPVLAPQNASQPTPETLDPQAMLQANKGAFFFRLERELEKVNKCYLQKEAELRLRLQMLIDKKRLIQSRNAAAARNSTHLRNLLQGFQQFNNDLNKLQQYIDVNGTAFVKILKKWDKTSKSKTKELYLSRAVEVQPCFNQEVLSHLSDQATTNRLELEALGEGERLRFDTEGSTIVTGQPAGEGDSETDNEIQQAAKLNNLEDLQSWIERLKGSPDAERTLTRAFLNSVDDAPITSLELLVESQLVNLHAEDDINGRNCLHEAAIAGREDLLALGVQAGVNVARKDVYGRIPLHYACMYGQVTMMARLLQQDPTTINDADHDRFTPLVHGIVNHRLECVHQLLQNGARIEPEGENDHIPLNLACQYAAQDIVQMLLERQARILPDAEGLYPQHLVARAGKWPDILLLLEAHGADLDQRDKLYQWTPLFHAASEGCVATLKVLLDKGVDIAVEDEKGLSAMYYAVWEGHLECMQLLTLAAQQTRSGTEPSIRKPTPQGSSSSMPSAMAIDHDGIPDLELPPPIIPLRRYGHNFLDSKCFIQISFDPAPLEGTSDAILFYHDSKYPAARLTISSKSSDLIPRNITLPLQDEDAKRMAFQVESLAAFTLEFDIYPTFGARRLAHGVALPDVFAAVESSKGHCAVPLFDPRLRVIGRIAFRFQVIKPCTSPSAPTNFAGSGVLETYWKATTLDSQQPDTLVTGSSLIGDYVQLNVQLTADGVPVLHPHWGVESTRPPNQPLSRLTLTDFQALVPYDLTSVQASISSIISQTDGMPDLSQVHVALTQGHFTLQDALESLPQSVHVALNILYPTQEQEQRLGFRTSLNINEFADAVLRVVFDHARRTRSADKAGYVRSIVFMSWNPDICAALNWKQPNYPVLLCNDLGVAASDGGNAPADGSVSPPGMAKPLVVIDGRNSMSVKDAVRLARENNFMGLVCTSRLLTLVPALMTSIKVAGLVLVSDTSRDVEYARRKSFSMPEGVDGILKGNGVLRFNDSVDM